MYRTLRRHARGSGGRIALARRKKQALASAAALLALLGLLVWRLSRGAFAWHVFLDAFRGLNPFWLAAAIVFIYLSYLGRALRWRVMLRPLRPDASLAALLSATMIGFAAVVLLGRAGELVRPYLIAGREKVSFSSQMAAWLLERIFDLLMVLAIFGFALAIVPSSKLHLGIGLRWIFRAGGYLSAGICVICVGLIFGFSRFSGIAGERLSAALGFLPARFQTRVQSTAAAFAEGMRTTASANLLLALFGYSALEWAILVASSFCLFRAFPATAAFSLTQVVVFMGLVSFGSVVQIPGIGGGFQVAAVIVLTQIFGLRLEVASGLVILLWGAAYLPVVPVGLILSLVQGVRLNKINPMRESNDL